MNDNRLELREKETYTSETTEKNYNTKKERILNVFIAMSILALVLVATLLIIYSITGSLLVTVSSLIGILRIIYNIAKEVLIIMLLILGIKFFKNK